MEREIAEQLIRAIEYPWPIHGVAQIGQRIELVSGDFHVVTKYGRYREVPPYLPIEDDPCRCRMRMCASGHVSQNLLEIVREGGTVHYPAGA